jgi:multidrug efflux system outer membrane protein
MTPTPAICRFATLASLAALSGCATSPERSDAPSIPIPSAWTSQVADNRHSAQAWLHDFQQPQLLALVEEALQHNADLRRAAARLSQAAAEARIAGAEQIPSAELGLDGRRQQISTFGPQSTGGVRFENYDLQLNLSWEIDLWGQLRDRSAAALAEMEAQQAEFIGARLSIAAQVCKRWFNHMEAQQQVALSEKTTRSYRANLHTIAARFQRGLSSGLELRRMRSQTASAEAELEMRRRTLDRTTRQLESLLGRYPDASLTSTADLPELPLAIPAGLPAELLTRRPDLVAAERRLAAAEATWHSARKQRLPAIRLTASGGRASQDFDNLLNSDFSVWSLGANLTQPIFQGGRIRASIDRSASLREQAAAQYHNTALQAFLEVESTLAAETHLLREYQLLSLAAEQASAAETLAAKRYRDGTSDFLNTLDAQRSAAQARSKRLALRNRLLQNRIDLYLALGGAFEPVS